MMNEEKILKILLDSNYLTSEDIEKARKNASKKKIFIINELILSEILTSDLLGQAIAEFYQIDYSDLNSYPPSKSQVWKIPEDIAKEFRIVLFEEKDDKVIIATDNPWKEGIKEIVENIFSGKKIIITYSLTEDIDNAFIYYRGSLKKRFKEVLEKKERIAPKIIEVLLEESFSSGASDIHIEPKENKVIIRLRIDGFLHEVYSFSKEYYENILNRMKIMAHLKIDEHFSHQDGGVRYSENGNNIDLRVSIVPTIDGEKIAIRVLSEYIREFSFKNLGLSENHEKIIKKSISNPFGMILVSGPTGSGKTTTLYAILKVLNQPEVNIMTIEDPVEYKISGINQIKTNPQAKLNFSEGLRAIIRQDPDIIFLGEIRDGETAEIAVNAALIGHLLLSTFHANDASSAIPRFLSMDIEPFLLSSTLDLIISQRLVRKICEICRQSYFMNIEDIKKTFSYNLEKYFNKTNTFYIGKGCGICNNTGFKGRTAIFEMIQVNDEIKKMILEKSSAVEIWKRAKLQGSISLFEDGVDKIKNGTTTLEEVLRVTKPPIL